MELCPYLLIVTVQCITLSPEHHHRRSAEDTLEDTWGHVRPGVCLNGQSISCCPGWKNASGICQPVCIKSCINGKCVAPEKCLCSKRYKEQQCDKDVNECGFIERICSQCCMNTEGSYLCYCEPGYTLSTDGHTCTREAECSSMRCQFGCQIEMGEEVRCLCPPGLHLATDNKPCEDKDECFTGSHQCSRHAQCVNTDGSYTCQCSGELLR